MLTLYIFLFPKYVFIATNNTRKHRTLCLIVINTHVAKYSRKGTIGKIYIDKTAWPNAFYIKYYVLNS
jgi:hypothetical protein